MEGALALTAWVCGPPLRPVDHSHLTNYAIMGAHGSSSSCTLYPGSFIQADRSLYSGTEGLSSAYKLTSASFLQRCGRWLFTSLTFFSGKLATSSTLHPKNYFWKALGHFLNCQYIN